MVAILSKKNQRCSFVEHTWSLYEKTSGEFFKVFHNLAKTNLCTHKNSVDYFPIQKVAKMFPRRSSVEISPVMDPK